MKQSICNIQVQVKIPVEFDEKGEPLGFIMNAIAPQLDNLTWADRSCWISPEEAEEAAKLLEPIEVSRYDIHTQEQMDAGLKEREERDKIWKKKWETRGLI